MALAVICYEHSWASKTDMCPHCLQEERIDMMEKLLKRCEGHMLALMPGSGSHELHADEICRLWIDIRKALGKET